MTGAELESKFRRKAFIDAARRVLPSTDNLHEFWGFIQKTRERLGASSWSVRQIELATLRQVMGNYPSDQLNVFLPDIKTVLEALGWYDETDKIPWLTEYTPCSKCERFRGAGATQVSPCTHVCSCGRRWWRAGDNTGWQQVLEPERWDNIRYTVKVVHMFPRPAVR